MKLLFLLLLPIVAVCAEPDVAKTPWPKPVRDFPQGENVTFLSGKYEIRLHVPDDPDAQAAGGSGGPIVEITVRDPKSRWSVMILDQSVGERLLEPHRGKPQIEIWGRGGGGYWSRGLYRFISGKFRCIRIDQFEESPRHDNEKTAVAELPAARRGKGDQQSEKLYFVETRLPDHE